MQRTLIFLGWIFGSFFFFLFLLSLFSEHYIPSIFVFIIAMLLIPPLRQLISDFFGIPLPLWVHFLFIPLLLFLFVFLIFTGMGNKNSIYKNPEIEKKLMTIYENRLAQWPVQHESRYINTRYGKVFVIISGPKDAPPIIIAHMQSILLVTLGKVCYMILNITLMMLNHYLNCTQK